MSLRGEGYSEFGPKIEGSRWRRTVRHARKARRNYEKADMVGVRRRTRRLKVEGRREGERGVVNARDEEGRRTAGMTADLHQQNLIHGK